MISHSHTALFVHIPKAAGQSVEQAFIDDLGLSWENRESLLLKPNQDKHKGPPRLAHLTAQEYLKFGYLTQTQFDEFFKFTVVRNPWDRLLSEYNYRKALGLPLYQCEFKRFVLERLPKVADDNYDNGQDLYRHIIPQTHFIFDDNDNRMVDFVARFEHLERDFYTIAQRVGLKVLVLPHKNATAALKPSLTQRMLSVLGPASRVLKLKSASPATVKKPFQNFYDNETQAFVAQYYARDINLLKYHFDENSASA
ncbi:sulfotransferase family 2 domain-containing protein [Pseudoalteromonas xiamenensis]